MAGMKVDLTVAWRAGLTVEKKAAWRAARLAVR